MACAMAIGRPVVSRPCVDCGEQRGVEYEDDRHGVRTPVHHECDCPPDPLPEPWPMILPASEWFGRLLRAGFTPTEISRRVREMNR